MNISSPTDSELERMTESHCPFNSQCEECEYDCDTEEKFCKGKVEFKVWFGLDILSGFVKIPTQEHSISDNDFEIWIHTSEGDIEDCDCNVEINPYIEDFIWGTGDFLETICDNAHKKTTLQFDEIILCGEECDEIYLDIDGTDFEWDVKEVGE